MKAISLILISLFGCATRMHSIPPVPVSDGAEIAFTQCDDKGVPYSWMRMDYDDDPIRAEIKVHETGHKDDMKEMGCKVFSIAYTHDITFRLAAEARAFCAQVAYAQKTYGLTYSEAVNRYSTWFAGAYSANINYIQAKSFIEAQCPK